MIRKGGIYSRGSPIISFTQQSFQLRESPNPKGRVYEKPIRNWATGHKKTPPLRRKEPTRATSLKADTTNESPWKEELGKFVHIVIRRWQVGRWPI